MRVNFTEKQIDGAMLAPDFIRHHARLCITDAQDYGVDARIRIERIEQMFENRSVFPMCSIMVLPDDLIAAQDTGFRATLKRMAERRGFGLEFV